MLVVLIVPNFCLCFTVLVLFVTSAFLLEFWSCLTELICIRAFNGVICINFNESGNIWGVGIEVLNLETRETSTSYLLVKVSFRRKINIWRTRPKQIKMLNYNLMFVQVISFNVYHLPNQTGYSTVILNFNTVSFRLCSHNSCLTS